MAALIDYASSDLDEGLPADIFEPLVEMLSGPDFGYRGAAVYRDEAKGWHRVAATGQMSHPELPAHGGSCHFTMAGSDLRLELMGGGGGWVLLIRRRDQQLESHERSLLTSMVDLVNNILDQTTYTNLLTQSERHYRHIYSHANLGIFFSRVGAGLQHANPGLLALLGYSTEREMREALDGQVDVGFYDPPEDRQRFISELVSVGQVHDFRTRLRRHDGSLVPVSVTANLVQDPDQQQEDLKFFGFVTDRSSDEACNEAFRGQRQAEVAALDKVRFLASVSHELRTPLNGVMGMADLLAASDLDHESQVAVGVIRQAAEQLQALADRMQTYTQLETGKLTLVHEPFAPRDLLDDVLDQWRAPSASKSIDLITSIDADVADQVRGDRRQCATILNSLVENAVKFTDAGGEVRVEIAAEGETVRLCVRDTGCGMSDEQLDRLQRREHEAGDLKALGGVGLGLAMTWKLIDLMDGRFWAESDLGRGSRMSVLLPLPTVSSGPAASDDFAGCQDGLSILVVEDNPVNQLVARKLLESLELDVRVAADGRQAVSMLAGHAYDLVFMDLQMPGMDGFETTRALRSEVGYKGPVVAMTAHATEYHRDKCRQAGMNGFVTKPLERQRLADFFECLDAAETDSWLWLEPEDNRPLS